MAIYFRRSSDEGNRKRKEEKKARRSKLTDYEKLEIWAAKLRRKNAVGVFTAPSDIARWENEKKESLCDCHGQLTFRRLGDGHIECTMHGRSIL